MRSLNRFFLILIGLMGFSLLMGQYIPSKPFSYPIFSPQLINPAITGSKDFKNINLVLRVNGSPGAQMLSYNSRLNSKKTGTSLVPGANSFSNFGLGGYLYQEELESSRNIGFGVSGAYHIALGDEKLSALSIGLTARGTYNMISDDSETTSGETSSFNPNLDAGIYYYGPSAFVGISANNVLGMLSDTILTIVDEAYIPREFHLYGGYKFILSRKNAIIFEPSLLLSHGDSTLFEDTYRIAPMFKFYMQNFYFGTFVKRKEHLNFFFQYQFPKFYTGLLVDFPRKGFLTADNIILELTFGLNIGKDKRTFSQTRHW